jgi:hypothetical protein
LALRLDSGVRPGLPLSRNRKKSNSSTLGMRRYFDPFCFSDGGDGVEDLTRDAQYLPVNNYYIALPPLAGIVHSERVEKVQVL